MTETFLNQNLRFNLPQRSARGRAIRLDTVLDDILSAHRYPAAITHVLAEAVTLAALLGSLLKQAEGQLTMQAQTDNGVVELLVADYRNGEVRGHVRYDEERLAVLGPNPSLFALFGKGYLAITFDRDGGRGRYQGIVPLEGDSLADACQIYFEQSEQIPTLIKIAITADTAGCRAGGLLLQHLPDGEEGRERLHVRLDHPDWEHVAILGSTLSHNELVDPNLSLEEIVWRLFHEEDEVRVEQGSLVQKGCRCTIAHYEKILNRFSEEDRADMRDDYGNIVVDCAFCSRKFSIAGL